MQIPLPKYKQAVVDSQWLYHGGHHRGPELRYALIVTVESGPELVRWIAQQMAAPSGRDTAARGER